MGTLAKLNSVTTARRLVDGVANGHVALYGFVGGATPWEDDESPPATNSSVACTDLEPKATVSYGKKITGDYAVLAARRVPWESNTVYDHYDHEDGSLHSKNFYVVNSDEEVYKCLYNGGGVPSTVMPSLASAVGTFQTGDGYVWKFLYRVSSDANSIHYSPSFVVVEANTSVQGNAVPGSVDIVEVTSVGSDYRTSLEGYVGSVVNSSVIELSDDACTVPGFYDDCSIYLHSTPGGSQLRTISSYSGGSRLASVTPLLDVFSSLGVSVDSGEPSAGEEATQSYSRVNLLALRGNFNAGDSVEQSDVGATGVVISSNSTAVQLSVSSEEQFAPNSYPILNLAYAGDVKTGKASVSAGSSNVSGNGTAFSTEFSVGSYVRVGQSANSQLRRVVTVANDAHMTVLSAFTSTVTEGNVFSAPCAASPGSIVNHFANGEITYVNLDGQLISYGNTLVALVQYIPGETVLEVDSDGASQGVTGVVDFANSSHLILSSLSGSLSNTLYLEGQSSGQRAAIEDILSYPTLTVKRNAGSFYAGFPLSTLYSNGAVSSVGTVSSVETVPGRLTEFVVSPRVTIEGDGEGAEAYLTVSREEGLVNSVASVYVLKPGTGYTRATATVSNSVAYGSGAVLRPIVSTRLGHGSDAAAELYATYASIVSNFGESSEEGYHLPMYGSYRRFGLMLDPLWEEVYVDVGAPQRWSASLALASGSFSNGEVVTQASTNAAASVVWSNSTHAELASVSGPLSTGAILGVDSGSTANVTAIAAIAFTTNSAVNEVVFDRSPASAELTAVTNSSVLKLSSVPGTLTVGVDVVDQSSNARAEVLGIRTANGSANAYASFGLRFNQHARVTLSSNTSAFSSLETVRQANTGAYGVVVTVDSDVDLAVSNATGSFFVGNEITDSVTNAAGRVVGVANSSFIKLSGVSGAFGIGDIVINSVGIEAEVTAVYPVLTIASVVGSLATGPYNLVGDDSGAIGRCELANTISYPELVPGSGDVVYVTQRSPFPRRVDTRERFSVVLSF